MPNTPSTFLSDQLASPELGRSSRVIETLHPDAVALTAVALAATVPRLAVVVPARHLEACCRTLAERLPASTVTAVRWGDGPFSAGPVVVLDERMFFEALSARNFGVELPEFDHWLIAAGDGLAGRLQRALRTTMGDARVCGFLESRLGLPASVGSTSLVPPALLGSTELMAVPYPLREDSNRVFYLERARRGRVLRSVVVEVATVLRPFFQETTATVLGRALAIDCDLTFTGEELGLDAEGVVDPAASRSDLLLFVPPMPRAVDKEWPARVIDATRRAACVPGDVTVLASAWNRGDIGMAIRSQLAEGSTAMAHPNQADAEGSDVLVLDRLPTASSVEPAHVAQRRTTPLWFLQRAVPRSLQRFRYLVGQLARGGAVAVLDGRMRSKWAEGFWRAVPGETTEDWATYRRWVNEMDGGDL